MATMAGTQDGVDMRQLSLVLFARVGGVVAWWRRWVAGLVAWRRVAPRGAARGGGWWATEAVPPRLQGPVRRCRPVRTGPPGPSVPYRPGDGVALLAAA